MQKKIEPPTLDFRAFRNAFHKDTSLKLEGREVFKERYCTFSMISRHNPSAIINVLLILVLEIDFRLLHIWSKKNGSEFTLALARNCEQPRRGIFFRDDDAVSFGSFL